MYLAVKANKQVAIDEKEAEQYANDGYDIYEKSGATTQIVMHAADKTVPYAQHGALKAELDASKAEIKALKAEVEALKKTAKAAGAQ